MSDLTEARVLPLTGSLRKPVGWLIALTSIPVVIATGVLAVVFLHNGPTRAHPPLFFLFSIPALVLLVQSLVVRGIARAGVSIDQGALVVNTGMGTKRVPISKLRKHGLRIVDLNERNELRPMWRLWGTGLPGLSAGWFRLRNGEKAVCLLLERRRVTYLRSDEDNLTLLLSLANPDPLRALLER